MEFHEYSKTKFFALFIQEMSREDDKALATSPQYSPAVPVLSGKVADVELEALVDAVLGRRNFAIACMTPDKFARASLRDLAQTAKSLTDLGIFLKSLISKEGGGDNKGLSDDEKQRIKKFIARNLGV